MADIEDPRDIAPTLPETTEGTRFRLASVQGPKMPAAARDAEAGGR
jgi:hypothetical protein